MRKNTKLGFGPNKGATMRTLLNVMVTFLLVAGTMSEAHAQNFSAANVADSFLKEAKKCPGSICPTQEIADKLNTKFKKAKRQCGMAWAFTDAKLKPEDKIGPKCKRAVLAAGYPFKVKSGGGSTPPNDNQGGSTTPPIDKCKGVDCPPGQVCSKRTGRCYKPRKRCRLKCQNGAKCSFDTDGNPTCQPCPEGFVGDLCENADPCSGFCKNEGTCELDAEGKPKCTCPDGWTGEKCDKVDFCWDKDLKGPACQNGGECKAVCGPDCACADGFVGDRCDLKDPCLNNGSCGEHGKCQLLADNSAQCKCKDGYFGATCTDKTVCPPAPTFMDHVRGIGYWWLLLLIFLLIFGALVYYANKLKDELKRSGLQLEQKKTELAESEEQLATSKQALTKASEELTTSKQEFDDLFRDFQEYRKTHPAKPEEPAEPESKPEEPAEPESSDS